MALLGSLDINRYPCMTPGQVVESSWHFFIILVIVFCLELAAAYTAYNKQETIRHVLSITPFC
ncbi:hypothetical protein ANCDUO_06579 [Ancylostoma duodenale]|uniref:Uncharacterized protein n=1 Tax=Ancylostoma duodenale TaxID=51022 RepID=A0A0C2H156_9BILA|nr:hypothetical protein ANCDUO_06579 [Ancylostoma duodenale]